MGRSDVGWRLRRPRVDTQNYNFLVTPAGGRVQRSRPSTRPNGVGRPQRHDSGPQASISGSSAESVGQEVHLGA